MFLGRRRGKGILTSGADTRKSAGVASEMVHAERVGYALGLGLGEMELAAMLFKSLRAGNEVILATTAGRGAGFTYGLAEVEAVKSALAVVAGYKFNFKDGRGRTVPHFILPATAANRAEYLGHAAAETDADGPAEPDVDEKQRRLALEGLQVIREADAADDDDLIDLMGVEPLVAFVRRWRQVQSGRA